MKPGARFLANSVLIHVHEPAWTRHVVDDVRFTMTVDQHRHIDAIRGSAGAVEWLLDEGLAEYKQVTRDPGDVELFLTAYGSEVLGPYLPATLGAGWQNFPIAEEATT